MNPVRAARTAVAVLMGAGLMMLISACGGSRGTDSTPTSGTGVVGEWASGREAELDSSARSGHQWLLAQGAGLPPDIPLLLDYLRRRYGLDVPVEVAALVPEALDGEHRSTFKVYSRLVDAGVVITAEDLAALTDEVDRITGPALACYEVALPERYMDVLGRAVALGRYERTHAVLALQWLREQGCIDDAEASRLSDLWADDLVKTVEHERGAGNGAGDLAVEAMAMLAYSGHAGRMDEAWIVDVLAAQHPDGSWPHGTSDTAPSAHTTVLAVWVLTALAHPDAPPEPWIPGDHP